jgi:hypothetical protein
MTSNEPVGSSIQPSVVYVPAPHRFQTSTATKVIAVVLALLTAGYMLPWAIAALRDLRSHVSVGLVNLLLGWTLIGWVVALVMSLRRLRPDEG